jgi:radical SAM superfamily enzyme YgiQ (UPF0313 family)
MKLKQVKKAVKTLKSFNVPILASYILGSPEDTHLTIQKTFALAKEINANQSKFMICTPFQGTQLYDMAIKRGLIKNNPTISEYSNMTYYNKVVGNMSYVSDEDLLGYQREAYRLFEEK